MTMQLTFEKKIPNDDWEEMEVTIEDNEIELRITDLGYVQMTHEEFEEVARLVKQYQDMAKIINLETK